MSQTSRVLATCSGVASKQVTSPWRLLFTFTVLVQFQPDRVSLPHLPPLRSLSPDYDRCPLSLKPLAEGQHHGNSRWRPYRVILVLSTTSRTPP